MGEPTFEEALSQLEALVARLEAGDLPLEEALRAFEEGVRLTRLCAARLEDAERRVHLLTRTPEGTEQEVPFDPGNEGEAHG
ncbi:MAG: exodeoxyribonuclease VII small subunit [candidate division NC10 bacterium]|nr:exodeoxyribonuclease VII small subunit [candidate division NC10 bacterium]